MSGGERSIAALLHRYKYKTDYLITHHIQHGLFTIKFHLILYVVFLPNPDLTIIKHNSPPTDQFFALFREGLLHVQSSHSIFHVVVDVERALSPHGCL